MDPCPVQALHYLPAGKCRRWVLSIFMLYFLPLANFLYRKAAGENHIFYVIFKIWIISGRWSVHLRPMIFVRFCCSQTRNSRTSLTRVSSTPGSELVTFRRGPATSTRPCRLSRLGELSASPTVTYCHPMRSSVNSTLTCCHVMSSVATYCQVPSNTVV